VYALEAWVGTLYVVATPIGNLEDVTLRALRVLRESDCLLAEDTRHTRILLGRHGIAARPLSLHAHNEAARTSEILARLERGDRVALVSDAGTPLVSDPGERLVAAAAAAGHAVVPVPGPSAVLAALSVAGLPTSRFTMLGFLPRRASVRAALLQRFRSAPDTLVLFEAPGRVAATLAALHAALGDRDACVARELTKLHEECVRGPLSGSPRVTEAPPVASDAGRGGRRPTPRGAGIESDAANALIREQVGAGRSPRDVAAELAERAHAARGLSRALRARSGCDAEPARPLAPPCASCVDGSWRAAAPPPARRNPRARSGPPPKLAIAAPRRPSLPARTRSAMARGAPCATAKSPSRIGSIGTMPTRPPGATTCTPSWGAGPLAPIARRALVLDWIARHPRGIGWSPHPLSLRSASWLKLLLTPGALGSDESSRQPIRASLGAQLAHLARNLETHLLANHYLANLLALTLGGVALEGDGAEACRGHEPRLRAELAEQVLSDGLHCERSPMYHACLLEMVLDVLNVARSQAGRAMDPLQEMLSETAGRMLGALDLLTHPDGGIALFADSAFGIAQPPRAIFEYAARLGSPRQPARAGVLDAGGYVRIARGPFVLLASVAGPMPAYQPGHAHCDALSFELSVDGERVVTDTGVHEYIPGRLRDLSRPRAPRHPRGGRRGGRALGRASGSEAGPWWPRGGGALRPRRRPLHRLGDARYPTPACVELSDDALTIRDRLEVASGAPAGALPLAPDVEVRLDATRARLRLPRGGWLRIDLEGGPALRVERAPYFPEFGRRVDRAVLVAEAEPWPATALRITRPRSISGS
jgi:16S rRNA (cytidine1402-2'-O)-methyltransferase